MADIHVVGGEWLVFAITAPHFNKQRRAFACIIAYIIKRVFDVDVNDTGNDVDDGSARIDVVTQRYE